MEKLFAELLNRVIEPGAGASILTVVFLMIAYFKYLKPYLTDFEFIKSFLKTIPSAHDEFTDRFDKVDEMIKDSTEETTKKVEELARGIKIINSREHDKLANEFSNIKYLLEEVVRKSEKISDRDMATLNDILLELSKLQSKIEYINVGSLGGMKK